MTLVDLHVHTPASSCYQCKGKMSMDEHYLNVLKVYKEKNIKLIGITDHNTLKGYKRLIDIKSELENKLEILKNESKLNKDEISKCETNLELFRKVKMIPGVEFTAYPHIHMLLLFNENMNLEKIEDMMGELGYDTDYKKGRDLDNVKKIDVEEILKIGEKLGAINIAAHIDRETGLLNWLETEGIEDRNIFNNENLMGVHVLKKDTIKYLEKDVLKDRKKKLCFIKASDFHNEINDMEKRISYINLESLDFKGLKHAFENSEIELKWE